MASHLYEFGPFLLDPQERLLLRDGQPTKLTDKVFELLCVLVVEHGHLLTKDELIIRIWPEDKFVEEGNLSRNISTLRTALNETPGDKFIETVPKRGYRFVATVRDVAGNTAAPAAKIATPRLDLEETDLTSATLQPDAKMTAVDAAEIEVGSTAAAGQPASAATGRTWTSRRSRRIGTWLLIVIAAFALIGISYRLLSHKTPATESEIKSLAVLPLKSLNRDPKDNYLGVGIADTIVTRMRQTGDLTVRPTSAVLKYANDEVDSLSAARQLQVDSVLEGTLQRAGDQLRINFNLLRTQDGALLWSDSSTVSEADSFRMQDDISQRVATRLHSRLRPQDKSGVATVTRSVNPSAYTYYLRAKYHAGLQNQIETDTAIDLLERAVKLDPNFAAAWAQLAREYRDKAIALKPKEVELEEKAYAAAQEARRLDPDLAEGHIALGLLLWTHSHGFPHERAVQEFRRALELNPNSDEAHHELAHVYNHIGLLDKAEAEIQKAVTIDPTNTAALLRVGVNLLYQGKYEQALAAFAGSEKFNPGTWGYLTAWALFQMGRKDEAAARINEFLKNYPNDEGGLLTSMQALMAAEAGDNRGAEQKIKRSIELGKGFGHFHHAAYAIASAYALMNKHEDAIRWLQMTADDGFPCYPLFERDPNLNNLRQDPMFIAFMNKLKEQCERYRSTL